MRVNCRKDAITVVHPEPQNASSQPGERDLACVANYWLPGDWGLEVGPGTRIDLFGARDCVEVVMIPAVCSNHPQIKTGPVRRCPKPSRFVFGSLPHTSRTFSGQPLV